MAQLTPNAPMTSWQVTSQRETMDLGPGGTMVPGVQVSFRTAAGNEGSVFLPHAIYSEQNVRAAIATKAALMDRVGNLSQ